MKNKIEFIGEKFYRYNQILIPEIIGIYLVLW